MITDALYTGSVSLLQRLIAIESFSKKEEGTADAIVSFLNDKDIPAHRLFNNVWVVNKYYDAAKPTILLNSHHDTVKPDKDYTLDPFEAIISDGRLHGLGSNDAGGCLVSLLAAFLYYYDRNDLKYNLLFAATGEEEISGPHGIEAVLPELGKIDCAIVGEPTLMDMAVAEKGLMVLDCISHGLSGHAARNEGNNAIYKAIKDITWFRDFQFPESSALLGPVKMSVTVINGGAQHNIVPAGCNFTVDVRINDCYTHEQVLAVIREHVEADVVPRSMRLRATSISQQHVLVQAGLSLGKKCFGSATMSDKALMSFPALKMGPGDSARSHTADEFIYLNEIKDGIDTYIALLNKIL